MVMELGGKKRGWEVNEAKKMDGSGGVKEQEMSDWRDGRWMGSQRGMEGRKTDDGVRTR